MKRYVSVGGFLCMCLFLAARPSFAGTMNALISGNVYANGGPLPDATVRLNNPVTGYRREVKTNSAGEFAFASVPPANGYLITVEAEGFESAILQDYNVEVGDETYVTPPFILSPILHAIAPSKPLLAPVSSPKVLPKPQVKVSVSPAPEVAAGTKQPQPKQVASAAPKISGPAPVAPVTAPLTTATPATIEAAGLPPSSKVKATSAPTVSLDLLNTETGGVIDNQVIRTLPLANRDFFTLALLVPGTYPVEQGSALQGASLVVNGVRADMNDFLLDGADDNDYTINQSLPFQIVAAMQEFRVQTGNSPAEFGRSGGAQINTISREGTNKLHGSLFEFFRNSALSSQNALSAYNGGTFAQFAQETRVVNILHGPAPYTCTTATPPVCTGSFFPNAAMSDPMLQKVYNAGDTTPLNQNQFGANLGGPIHRDKAFFFVNWESFRAADNRPAMVRVPDTTCRNGTTCAQNNYGAAPVYPNSAALFSQLVNLYPEPNVPQGTVLDAFGHPISNPTVADSQGDGAFFTGQPQNYTNSDNFLERVDVSPGHRMAMSFKHNLQDIRQLQAGEVPALGNYPGSGFTLNGRNQNFSYNFVETLSPLTVNEFRAAWNRFRLGTLPLDHTLDPSSVFKNLNFTNQGFPSIVIGGLGSTFGPYADLGSSFSAPSDRADNVWSAADSLTRTWGNHVIKVGGEFRYNRLDINNRGAGRGLVTFYSVPWGQYSGEPDLASIPRVSPVLGGGFDRSFRDHALDAFIQDTWRPRPNLTLNIGLRYEDNQAPFEARNRLVNDYPGACGAGSIVCLIQAGTNKMMDSNGTLLGAASFTAPRAGYTPKGLNLGPRIGLAWDPRGNGRTVFRAGYAIAYNQQSVEPSVDMLLNPPYVQQAMSFAGNFVLGDTFPAGFPLDFGSGAGIELNNVSGDNFNNGTATPGSVWFAQPYSITARAQNLYTPYVEQYFAGFEHKLGGDAVFEMDYVGSGGRHLPMDRLLLECTASVFASTPLDCLPRVYAPLGGGAGTKSDSVVYQENAASSDFNSLLVRLDTREFHRLTLHVHYQWAHSIDNASSAQAPVFLLSPPAGALIQHVGNIDPATFSALNNINPTLSLQPGLPIISTTASLPNDSTNAALLHERANSSFDVRQRVVVYFTYDIPQWAPRIGSGWQIAGITTFQAGQPFTVYGNFFGLPLRPNQVSAAVVNNSNPNAAIDNAIPAGCNVFGTCTGTSSKSAFDVTPTVSFEPGTLPRNSFTGPSYFESDFSVLKSISINERVKAQIRFEVFNLLNTTNYRQPYSSTGLSESIPASVAGTTQPVLVDYPDPFFGQILQANNPREIQLGVKFDF